jgi:hypothetical protein
MRRLSESGRGRRRIANLGVEADIGLRAVMGAFMHARRILPRRGFGFHHRRQNLVVDFDAFGAVFCRVQRFGDDHGHGFADKARFIGR